MLPKTFGLHKFAYMKDDVAAIIQAGGEDEFNRLANVVHRHVVSDKNILSRFIEILDRK